MNNTAINRQTVSWRGSSLTSNPEAALLGGLAPGANLSRVMKANHQSSHVSPADLDAFLRGYLSH